MKNTKLNLDIQKLDSGFILKEAGKSQAIEDTKNLEEKLVGRFKFELDKVLRDTRNPNINLILEISANDKDNEQA